MAKLTYSFKYFDNNLSLFELAEKQIPFDDHKKNFDDRYSFDPNESFLDAELDEIKNKYSVGNGPAVQGYRHRLRNWDHKITTFAFDFYLWGDESAARMVNLQDEINHKKKNNSDRFKPSGELTRKRLETFYLKALATGVNDARLLLYIEKLKRKKQPNSTTQIDKEWFINKIRLKGKNKTSLIKHIETKYKNAQPREVATLLLALETHHTDNTISNNTTYAHEAMQSLLGNIGTRPALNTAKGRLLQKDKKHIVDEATIALLKLFPVK